MSQSLLFLDGDLRALDAHIKNLQQKIQTLIHESARIERENQSSRGVSFKEEGDFNPAESDLHVLNRRYAELQFVRARAEIAPALKYGVVGVGSVVSARKASGGETTLFHVTGYQWGKEQGEEANKKEEEKIFKDSRIIPVSYSSDVGLALMGTGEGAIFTIGATDYIVASIRNDAPPRPHE